MSEQEPLTLAHPNVQAVKEKFLKAHKRRKINVTFEQLFDCFQSDCIRPASIAEEAGVTRQAVDALYNRYFKNLFQKEGGERRNACTLEQSLVRKASLEAKLFTLEPIATIVAQARAAGCLVETSASISNGYIVGVKKSELIVNGHRCSVHHARKASVHGASDNTYARFTVTKAIVLNVKGIIFRSEPEGYKYRTFIIPSALLLNKIFSTNRAEEKKIVYLPVVPSYKIRKPTNYINYWQYEDAWHLLSKPKEDPPTPR